MTIFNRRAPLIHPYTHQMYTKLQKYKAYTNTSLWFLRRSKYAIGCNAHSVTDKSVLIIVIWRPSAYFGVPSNLWRFSSHSSNNHGNIFHTWITKVEVHVASSLDKKEAKIWRNRNFDNMTYFQFSLAETQDKTSDIEQQPPLVTANKAIHCLI